MLRLKQRQQGDTLVEVLIAIAIVSLILTAAYVITNKNTLSIQGNQERIQAQHLAATQIESLRAQNGLNTSGDCFVGGTETDPTGCNNLSSTGSGASYTAFILSPGGSIPAGVPCLAASATAYTICVYWTSLGNTKTNNSNVTMYYRLQ
ncbi:MAG TPA: type II secretion system protein [Candidatus Saccharimonadales bacterium]|nr:type II secretion system protein [Candidatus Saccharimonadales bacterium]